MEAFAPGAEFGRPYEVFIYVCTNPVSRSFEKCDIAEGQRVLKAFQTAIMQRGLGQRVFIFQAGCMLGCKERGTTIAVKEAQDPALRFWREFTIEDVNPLIDSLLCLSQ